ncbi:PIN domain-containing protein [Melaminivora jejuensis]|uniref:type II toxin-antitoxin system VapC family toxin n=1 Tax=Melaminivora jejuensis TaxID=1267217 RepID=UPI001ADFBFE6|nr:hypothetical protein [Melaminivora jejuensis]UHJ63545.1 hypothetical protein LVC68_08805 [Melaminivora jejuensis]
MNIALLDAGPLIALFDQQDLAHDHYSHLLTTETSGWHLTTTWPCLVEASHFLLPAARWKMFDWVAMGGVSVFPFDPGHLEDMLTLMRRYTDRRSEMDFADASLVWAATETGITQIWTIDVRDFYRYRLPDGRAFEIL